MSSLFWVPLISGSFTPQTNFCFQVSSCQGMSQSFGIFGVLNHSKYKSILSTHSNLALLMLKNKLTLWVPDGSWTQWMQHGSVVKAINCLFPTGDLCCMSYSSVTLLPTCMFVCCFHIKLRIHSFTLYHIILKRTASGLKPVPADVGALDKLPVHPKGDIQRQPHMLTITPVGNLESPINLSPDICLWTMGWSWGTKGNTCQETI